MYYRNANCAVVVYDITQTASLEKARSWIRELQRQADPNIVIALCGNKSDLSARRQVSQEEAQKYAQEEGLMWGETSAKTGEGVSDIFVSIGQCCDTVFCIIRSYVFLFHSQEAAVDRTGPCKRCCSFRDCCDWPERC
jgi:GTPase SAR1 family protein